MWDNSGHYLGIHYICIMLCTVKVEQLGLQSILVELHLTTLFSAASLNFFQLNHFNYTHCCKRFCASVCDAFKMSEQQTNLLKLWKESDTGRTVVISDLCFLIQFSGCLLCTPLNSMIDTVCMGWLKCVFNFYRPWTFNSVRLVIWWKLYILLFEKRQSKGKTKTLLSLFI